MHFRDHIENNEYLSIYFEEYFQYSLVLICLYLQFHQICLLIHAQILQSQSNLCIRPTSAVAYLRIMSAASAEDELGFKHARAGRPLALLNSKQAQGWDCKNARYFTNSSNLIKIRWAPKSTFYHTNILQNGGSSVFKKTDRS